MDSDTRIAGFSLASAGFIAFVQLAWPGMPLYLSIPGMAMSLGFAAWFGAPWLRSISVTRLIGFYQRSRELARSWTVTNWEIPFSARTTYCDQGSMQRWESAKAEVAEQGKICDRLSAELNEATERHARPPSPMTEMTPWQIEAARAAHREAVDKLSRLQTFERAYEKMILHELVAQLRFGTLVAKAMPLVGGVAQREMVVPAHQWRVLELNMLTETATGSGLSYVGVVIGQPKNAKSLDDPNS